MAVYFPLSRLPLRATAVAIWRLPKSLSAQSSTTCLLPAQEHYYWGERPPPIALRSTIIRRRW
jgi:hypothetical protein